MSMRAHLVALAALAAVLIPLPPAGAAEVNFITDFGYNGRHSYFYVALDKGYYKAEGLEVNILRGQGSADAIKKVASGAAAVGFADAGALVLARGNDAIPVKLLSIVYATPPHAIFALADSGIKTGKDLEGRTVAEPAFSAIPLVFNAYAQAVGIDRNKVKWVCGGKLRAAVAVGDTARRRGRAVHRRRTAAGRDGRARDVGAHRLQGRRPRLLRQRSDRHREDDQQKPCDAQGLRARDAEGHAGRIRQSDRSRRNPAQVSQGDFAGGGGRRDRTGARAGGRRRSSVGR